VNIDSDVAYRRNRATRQRVQMWVSEFGKYQMFVDGCALLLHYYNDRDMLRSDYWTLVELHQRWSAVVNATFFWGNRHQIENFVPFADGIVADLVTEMLRRKKKMPMAQVDRPKNWRLDAKQVKASIDPIRVFEYYLPDMKKNGGKTYKATCLWHKDTRPSLVVYPEGTCHCYACGSHQDVFGIIMNQEQCDFATSVARAMEIGG